MNHERAESKGVAVVTGGTAGVGRATVRELARQGFDVAVLARGADGLLATRGEVEALGRRALTISVDVSETEAVERAADRIEAELGPIDVWVNDAMATVLAPFDHVAPKDYDRATAVIYLGAVNGTRAALVRMKKRDRGSIVQVGSALAYRSVPLQACYCGAKAAIRGFTDSLRSELLHDKSNIRLSMVQLPAVNTPQFGWVKNLMPGNARPVAPTYQPEIPARAIAWAATHRRREVYVAYSTIVAIVFGAKLFPGTGDWYLGRTGYEGQQTKERHDPAAPDNLWSPAAGDHGAHGTFDDESRSRSPMLWLSLHRGVTIALGIALFAAIVLLVVACTHVG